MRRQVKRLAAKIKALSFGLLIAAIIAGGLYYFLREETLEETKKESRSQVHEGQAPFAHEGRKEGRQEEGRTQAQGCEEEGWPQDARVRRTSSAVIVRP